MIDNTLAPTLPLDGIWQFQLGEDAPWQEITVPGCWEAQGYPNEVDGPARYRRTVLIPADWQRTPIFLEFDAVSYAVTIYWNGQRVGQHLGMWTPFAVEITAAAQPGVLNTIELEVWKPANALTGGRYPLRTTLAGFLPDVATTFGGLWQTARLRAGTAYFQNLQIEPDPDSGALRVHGAFTLDRSELSRGPLTLHVIVMQRKREVARVARVLTGLTFDLSLLVPHYQRWSPYTPACYQVYVSVRQTPRILLSSTQQIGFRRLSTQGEQVLLNGQPIHLRGLLSWGWAPKRIAPNYTADEVRAEFRRVRAQGFNLIKLCLFVPNQTYFDVADEEGMLLWQEWPLWLPEVTAELRQRVAAEYAAYMVLTRQHPSVVLYSVGCELNHQVDATLLGELARVVRGHVRDVLVCDNSGSGEAYGGLAVDFADFTDYHTYGDLHFLEETLDNWRRDWLPVRPWLFGEFCDADGFRDLQEIINANGSAKPWWITTANPTHHWRPEVRALLEAEARLATLQLPFTTAQLVRIANAQSFMVRKYTLETVRKRAAVQGYVVTGLRDTPIATSGIFDDFDRPKWEPDAFRPFNQDAILALDGGRSRHWQHGGDRASRLDLYNWWAGAAVRLHVILNHTAATALVGGTLTWQVTDASGQRIAGATQPTTRLLPASRPAEVGVITFTLPSTPVAGQYQLTVEFTGQGVQTHNQWPLWLYPKPEAWEEQIVVYDPVHAFADLPELAAREGEPATAHGRVVVTSVLDAPVQDFLQQGGHGLLLQWGTGALPVRRGPFWREAVKLLDSHPLWERFPHAGFVDLQFFGLATDVMIDPDKVAAALPALTTYTPLLRRLDARAFTVTDYLVEMAVGKGKLLACTLRVHGGAGVQPTGLSHNVAGHYLLSLLVTALRDA